MQIIPLLLKEMEEEAAITRKMLERVPDHKIWLEASREKHGNAAVDSSYCRITIMGKDGSDYFRTGFFTNGLLPHPCGQCRRFTCSF